MVSLLIALIYLAFISLGLPDSLLGAGWPVMRESLSVPLSFMGGLSILTSLSTIFSSLQSDRLNRRFGTPVVTVVSVFLTALALWGYSVSQSFWELCLWSVPYGLGAGAIDAGLNNYVALHFSSRHMNWLHCFWGVGTILSPHIMSLALAGGDWHRGYLYVALIQVVIGLILLGTLGVWKIHPQTAAEKGGKPMKLSQVLALPGVKPVMLGFFAYCAAETTTMNWLSSFLVSVRGIGEETAAAFASLFFIGMTAGRFLCGFLSDRLGDRRIIRLGGLTALCGMVCVALSGLGNWLALGGFLIVGLGCAPIYPAIVHATPANFGPEASQSVIGIQMAGAYLGSTLMSPLFGVLGSLFGLHLLPFYTALCLCLCLVLVDRTFRTAKK